MTMHMEVFRRLRNTSRQLLPRSRARILEGFIDKLRCSGYMESTVKSIMESGVTFYYRKLKMDLQGGPKLNRRAGRDTVMARRAKLGAAQQWFQRRRGGEQEVRRKLDPERSAVSVQRRGWRQSIVQEHRPRAQQTTTGDQSQQQQQATTTAATDSRGPRTQTTTTNAARPEEQQI